ncbi:hypothetical protein [Rhodococcoides yunnanense]|nr:hypothetical protein [Rhodococcus yunnanensis]
MQSKADAREVTRLACPHSASREFLLIGLVLALGVLVALAIVIPAVVSS